MADSGAFASALALVTGGLVASYYRLRHEFDRTTTWLTLVMLVGATPLLQVIVQHRVADAALFAALATITAGVMTRPVGWPVQATIMAAATLAVPLIAPAVSARPTLFSPSNGFLALTPIVYIALIGLAATARRSRAEAAATIVALAIWPLTYTSLTSMLAFLARGLAAVIDYARRRPMIAAAPLVVGAIVWNYWLMVQYTAGMVPKDAPVSFAAMVRQQADVHTREPYIYPFAVPFNVLAAWREGIPVGRYDTLSAEPRRDRFEIAFDSAADRFLLDGWGAMGSSAAGPFRTITANRARLLFPLDISPPGIEVTLLTSLRGGSTANVAEAQIHINDQPVGRVPVSGAASEVRVRIAAADVRRIFRAGYNRLSIVPSSPARIAVHRLRVVPIA